MPIRIEYGAQVSPGLPGLAATAMRIRAAKEAAALAARRGGGGGGGGSGKQTNLARQQYDLAAQQAYYDKQASAQNFQQDTQRDERQSQLKSQGLKLEYSRKQRQQISQWTNSLNDLGSNPELSDPMREEMAWKLNQQIAGIKETVSLADVNEPAYAGTEKDVGMTWPTEEGSVAYRKADGTVGTLLKPSETAEGIERKAKIDREEERDKRFFELSSEKVKTTKNLIETEEYRTPQEIAKIFMAEQQAKDIVEQMEAQREQQRQQRQQLVESGAGEWVQQRISEGIDIQQMDVDLGPVIGPIQAIARQLMSKENRTPSEEADLQALLTRLRNYDPEAGIADFAIKELQALKKKPSQKSRSTFAQLNSIGGFGG